MGQKGWAASMAAVQEEFWTYDSEEPRNYKKTSSIIRIVNFTAQISRLLSVSQNSPTPSIQCDDEFGNIRLAFAQRPKQGLFGVLRNTPTF